MCINYYFNVTTLRLRRSHRNVTKSVELERFVKGLKKQYWLNIWDSSQLFIQCKWQLPTFFFKTLIQGGSHTNLKNTLNKRNSFMVADLQYSLLSFTSNDAKWELRRCSSCCILSAWKSFAFSSWDKTKGYILENCHQDKHEFIYLFIFSAELPMSEGVREVARSSILPQNVHSWLHFYV